MDRGKKVEADPRALQEVLAVSPHSGSAEEGRDSGLMGRVPAPMPAAKGGDDFWVGADAGRGTTHLTVFARTERTAPMQAVYIVDGARGKLYVRAFSETWRPEAERLELALNKAAAR